ncbi:MAG: type 2 lanthipeptide synthetase LanM [Eubacteriales bacterium]|nr:type 2 lanthipeptide synthetase LanM [Eubacteriales bacterium]
MRLALNELEQIAARSAFLKERLEGNTQFLEGREKEKRFHAWRKKVGGSGGEPAFFKRLHVEGITIKKAKEICAEVTWNKAHELPEWTDYINDLLMMLPADEARLEERVIFDIKGYLNALDEQPNADKKALAEIKGAMLSLLPFVSYAERRLADRLADKANLFSEKALSDISGMLANALLQLSFKTFSERLRIFILRKESFGFLMNLHDEDTIRYAALYEKELLSGGWKEIFLEYPVLPKLMVTAICNWVDHIDSFSTYLKEDMEFLEKEFNGNDALGTVSAIKGSISDAHNKGKGVLIPEFEQGAKIVFKPRNLGIDVAYERLINKLKDMEFPYELIAPRALNFESHGWIEFIENKPLDTEDQAKDFYRRDGALLCLVYALGGNDFHGENIIAFGEHPVLIDLETIIAFKMLQFTDESEYVRDVQKFVDILRESVLGIGFLPIWLTVGDDVCVDFGALTGSIPSSMPSFEGKTLSVFDYQEELLEGFGKTYDFFIENGEAFFDNIVRELFNDTVLRVLLRATNVYAKMLNQTISPGFLKDGFLYSVEIEGFAPAYLINVAEENVPRLWKLFLNERDALEERDIPIFSGHANERHIRNDRSILCNDYFSESVLERVGQKIRKLDAADKGRQLDFITESLSIYTKGCHNEGKKKEGQPENGSLQPLEKAELLSRAQSVYQEIMASSLKLGDQYISWISYNYDLLYNKTFIGQTTANLYDGLIGISLFTAALYSLNRDEKVKYTALSLLEPFRQSLRNQDYKMPVYRMNPGLGKGLGGIIKAFVMIGDYLEEAALYDDARYLIELITKEQIIKERHMNVLSGLAGLLPALLLCYEHFGHEYSLEMARLCGRQILKNKNTLRESGFGYGSSGILFMLMKLYNITRDTELLKEILKLAKQENSRYKEMIEQGGRGINIGSICMGTAGPGVLYMSMSDNPEDIGCPNIDFVLQQIQQYPPDYGDSLCCGNSGRLDFMIEASVKLHKPELLKEANRIMHWMINRKDATGHFNIEGANAETISNPSLFQGLSGIGYEMLRCLSPEKIGSVWF